MSISKLLCTQIPERQSNNNRELAQKFFNEIEQALLAGYSWYQITDAIKHLLNEEQLQKGFSASKVERYYRQIKSGAKNKDESEVK